ncbi:MAG: hypothetical protein ACODAC_03535 [Pseudomonadota bacterium]
MASTMRHSPLRVVGAYVAGVLVAYATAAMASTQWVLAELTGMGAPVGPAERLAATGHDLVGMASSYLPLIAVGLAIAFPVAAGVVRILPRLRPIGYPLAGGAAVLAIHVILNELLEITPIAAARTTAGLTVQALCGALGGWVFLRGLPRPAPRGAGAARA